MTNQTEEIKQREAVEEITKRLADVSNYPAQLIKVGMGKENGGPYTIRHITLLVRHTLREMGAREVVIIYGKANDFRGVIINTISTDLSIDAFEKNQAAYSAALAIAKHFSK